MSCQLMIIATFRDIGTVKEYLFPHLKDAFTQDDDAVGDWDDADWGWKDSDAGSEDQPIEASFSWLQECQVSVSPTGELIAVANQERLVLMAQKWDTAEEGEVANKYSKVFEDNIAQEDGEKISSVLCLPLASQKRSTHGGPDWTCVIVGFTSGWVRIYTENGTLMLSQIFSEEPVVRIKCRTYELPRYVADSEKHEEIAILCRRALVTIDGFSFFQSLRACRNQVARAAASGSDQIAPPPLAYKKWSLQEQDTISDHTTCGLVTPNTFDQMQTASVLGGYGATIKSTPPACHQYVTAGIGPYIGFYYAIEGSAQPMLSDVAHAVASKLKSALFSQISAASGWLGLSSKQRPDVQHKKKRRLGGWLGLGRRPSMDARQEKKKPKIEPATALPNRFGLPDKRRHGERVHLSPDNKLAAVTDSFGRVMLVDIHRGIALRMWKGYRDAQVGWIEVREDTATDVAIPQRHALFLVIYAPRRGILEVWTAQQGPRVAAFNVSKWCCLVCPGYSLMGLNNVTCRDVKVPIFSCYLLDPAGSVRTVEVPFHLALSDKNSKRARDLHLLKKLKVALHESIDITESMQTTVIEMLLDIKIASIRQQGLEKVLHTKHLPATFLQSVLTAVNQQLTMQAQEAEEVEGGSLDYESRMLEQFCVAEDKLLSTYMVLNKLNEDVRLLAPVPNTNEEMAHCLSVRQEELASLQSQMDTYHSVLTATPRVTFATDSTMTPIDFISCFTCHLQHREAKPVEVDSAGEDATNGTSSLLPQPEKPSIELVIQLKQGLTNARKLKLGNFLFHKVLKEGSSAEFNKVIEECSVSADNLMSLLVHLWLSEDLLDLKPAVHLHTLLTHITRRKAPSEVTVSHTCLSPWWHELRTMCTQSENVVAALVAAMVGKTVATEAMAKAGEHDNMLSASTDSADMSSWESVSMDRTQWTVLVKQLEDLLVLQCLLKLRPANRFAAAMVTGEHEPITVSIKMVLDGGRGVLPEVVAKWIASQAIPPSMLCMSDPAEKEAQQKAKPGEEISEPPNPIVEQLQSIQRRLPHSLDADVLMANCTWEYVLIWNRDPEVVFLLQQSIAYLRCIQNAAIQHGIAAMMWQMFVVKKVSAAAFLIDKVGKSPKERLCRRDVGVSASSLEKFLGVTVDLLDTLIHASQEPRVVPVLNIEDLWASVSGPTSLVELALEQKDSSTELVEHHYNLVAILHAIMAFSMRSIKPFSLFDTKGKNAFFKPIHTTPVLPSRVVDDSIAQIRQQFLCKVIMNAVLTLTDSPLPLSASTSTSSTPATTPSLERLPLSTLSEKARSNPTSPPPTSPTTSTVTGIFNRASSLYSRWPQLILKLGRELNVDLDSLRRHHVCELYSSGFDKLAEEVLLTVNDHAIIGSQLILIVGQRLAQSIFTGDPATSVDKLSNCPPTVSTWLKTVDPTQLRCPEVPLKDTAILIGHVVNQLPEGHSEYNMAISLVELMHSLM